MMRLREEQAQATVEMAIVLPVMIVVALIVYNLMVFVSATARFDRVAPDVVMAHGVSPEGDGGLGCTAVADAVEPYLDEAMEGYDVDIEVSCETDGGESGEGALSLVGSLWTFTCSMSYEPWPSGFSIAGVDLGAPAALVHKREVVVDPWRPGVVM